MSKTQRIADLEHTVRELREFRDHGVATRTKAAAILRHVLDLHQPRAVTARDGLTLELRCWRCRTDENHTWSNDNYMPWPCPTIAPFVAYATYPEAAPNTEETTPNA